LVQFCQWRIDDYARMTKHGGGVKNATSTMTRILPRVPSEAYFLSAFFAVLAAAVHSAVRRECGMRVGE